MTVRATIRHVDAFTSVPLEGNPAAVVDGAGIGDATMQRIALNQKLSETVFLLPAGSPDNHARLRIFTPATELPFAGHPVVAAAHVLISERIAVPPDGGPLLLETGAGVIPVAVEASEPPLYTMTQAAPQFRPARAAASDVAAALGLPPADIARVEDVSTGLWWTIAQVASFEAMLRIRPDYGKLAGYDLSIFCIGAGDPQVHVRVRTFAFERGVTEDPVTGSSNGCIAALIARDGLLPRADGEIRYVAEQGVEMGQPGRVFVRVTGTPAAITAHIGGNAVTVLRGELLLPG
jgi:PhzF family phenazine biosynthesis protein